MKKSILITGTVLGLGLAGLILTQRVSAEELSESPTIIQRLVERFGLNENDVKQIFEEEHADRHAEMMSVFEDRLLGAVGSGKLTQEQMELILAKKAELYEQHKGMFDMSRDERREMMSAHRDELKIWAEENDIPLGYLMGGMMRHGMGKGMGRGMR